MKDHESGRHRGRFFGEDIGDGSSCLNEQYDLAETRKWVENRVKGMPEVR